MNVPLIRNRCFLIQGKEVLYLFENFEFLKSWDSLWAKCSWSSIFQHKDFVINWFQIYSENEAILITDWDGKKMDGLLVLTFFGNDQITGPGFDQAEYQSWLSTLEENDHFITSAIDILFKEFPKKKIHFKYLPSATPISWLIESVDLKGRFFLKPYKQPLIQLDRESLNYEIKKKNRKEKINRLKRMGDLQFEEVATIKHFEGIIDEMILQNDFRKGALYDKTIFRKEPERRTFLLKMFELGILHVSILKLRNTIIASNAGFMGSEIVHLQGINSHSPFYSKYSPGILHFLMLGIHLCEKGKKYFDLTPGGVDGYKSMLANSQEIVYELWIANRSFVRNIKIVNWFKIRVKEILEKSSVFGFNFHGLGSSLINTLQLIEHKTKNIFSRNNSDGLNELNSSAGKIYFSASKIKLIEDKELIKGISIKINSISDLLEFKDEGNSFSKKDFLFDSLKRIELGNKLITITKNNDLFAVCWSFSSSFKTGEVYKDHQNLTNKSILTCSYYNPDSIIDILEIFGIIISKEALTLDDLIIEVSKAQKQIKNILKSNDYPIVELS